MKINNRNICSSEISAREDAMRKACTLSYGKARRPPAIRADSGRAGIRFDDGRRENVGRRDLQSYWGFTRR
jgi:hypothetical protein